MNHDDERDYAEEADNKAAMVAEGKAELEAATREAVGALADWVNDHYGSIHQALEKMAGRNEASAVEFADAPMVAKTLRESAASWRGMAGEMSTLVNAVWDTTPDTSNV